MGLEQLTLETGLNKVEVAIELLRAWEPPEGYYLAFSGGKDSVAIYDLAVKAGVKFDAHYCVSPIDPPQIFQFIKENYPGVQWDYHARGFWQIVDKNGLPMRQRRWCCRIIKEAGGDGRVVITGNRRAEGGRRRNQKCFEAYRNRKCIGGIKKYMVRPIINFDNYDIWQYIRENDLPYCELYNEGFKRLGCILCPFKGGRQAEREIAYFPKIAHLWLLAANRLVEATKQRGYLTKRGNPVKNRFETGQELFNWWVTRK